jgi:hypothetical protein
MRRRQCENACCPTSDSIAASPSKATERTAIHQLPESKHVHQPKNRCTAALHANAPSIHQPPARRERTGTATATKKRSEPRPRSLFLMFYKKYMYLLQENLLSARHLCVLFKRKSPRAWERVSRISPVAVPAPGTSQPKLGFGGFCARCRCSRATWLRSMSDALVSS